MSPSAPYNSVTADVVTELRNICGRDAVLFDDAAKLQKYSHDETDKDTYGRMPDVVVTPDTAEAVAAIVRLANRERIPVTPRGAGSGLSGGAVPLFGGILVSVERMNRIIEIDSANRMAVVEPGVVTRELDNALRDHGLFFAGYPMSEEFCFIGGNVAENAGGGRAVKYGVTGNYVMGLDVVTPTGELVNLGGKRVKDVTGYDLIHLMVGSEGTLGIFTRIVLKLTRRPKARMALLALFEDAGKAMASALELITTGSLTPSAIEFMDGFSFSMGGKSLKREFDYDRIKAALLVEVDGMSLDAVKSGMAEIGGLCRKRGTLELVEAHDEGQVNELWDIRKRIPWALKNYNPHLSVEDIVVPVASIADFLPQLDSLGKKYGSLIPVFGHAADGNLHAIIMKNPDLSMDQWRHTLHELLRDLYTLTAEWGGTISGEHGIGHKRSEYMDLVMSRPQLDMMRRVKAALDPNNIMNPGKIF